MEDYRRFRLNDGAELLPFAEDPGRFMDFMRRVFGFLDALAEGETVTVRKVASQGSVEIFVKMVCLYIDQHRVTDGPDDSYIEFNERYTEIRRVPKFVRKPHWRHFYS